MLFLSVVVLQLGVFGDSDDNEEEDEHRQKLENAGYFLNHLPFIFLCLSLSLSLNKFSEVILTGYHFVEHKILFDVDVKIVDFISKTLAFPLPTFANAYLLLPP